MGKRKSWGKKALLTFLLLACLGWLVACTGQQTSQTGAASKLYVLHDGDWITVVDSKGQVVLEPTLDTVAVVRDQQTEEQKYIIQTHIEAGAERDEYGYPANVTYTSTLYDLQGQQLRAPEEVTYGYASGDLIVCYTVEDCYVWNVSAGQALYENLESANLGQDCLLLCRKAGEGKQLVELVDLAGNSVKKFPEAEFGYSLDYGNLFVLQINGHYGVIDGSGNLIMEAVNDNIEYSAGEYAIARQDEKWVVYQLPEGKKVFESTNQINYYDGQTAILCKYQLTDYKSDGLLNDEKYNELLKTDEASAKEYAENIYGRQYNPLCYLADTQGQILSDGYDAIWACTSKLHQTAQAFCARNWGANAKKGDTCSVLDGSGQALFSYTGSGVYISATTTGKFVISDYDAHYDSDGNYIDHSKTMLVNAKGEPVIAEGTYESIDSLYDETGMDQGYLLAGYTTRQQVKLYDLLDGDGNVIISQLKSCTSYDGSRVVGAKGFANGLLDEKGNWIYQASNFNQLED